MDMRKKKVRNKKVRNKKKKIKLRVFLFLIAFAALLILILISPLFVIKNINFSKEIDSGTKNQILNMLGKPEGENGFLYISKNISGIGNIGSFFNMRAKNIEDKITFSFPELKDVEVKYSFPDTLEITSGKREPEYYVSVSGSYVCADAEGFVINIKMNEDDIKLPVVRGLDPAECKVGQYLQANDENKISTLKNIFNEVNKADGRSGPKLLGSIEFMDIYDYNDVWMFLHNDLSVHLGDLDNINYKIAALKQILASEEMAGKHGTIDLTVSNPIFKEKTDTSTQGIGNIQ